MKLSRAAAVAAAALLAAGCYYMPGIPTGNAKVALSVKDVPPNLVSAAVVVTAPGMATVATSGSGSSGSMTVSVPAGPARTFTLLLNSASATLSGSATVDLQPGETKSISLTPALSATQIVIPDANNGRIVQISDMNGTGWTAIDYTNLGNNPTGQSIHPVAIDFDNQGRIYVADSNMGLFRIDDINHALNDEIIDSSSMSIVAVDRTNGLVYYGTGSTTLLQKSVANIGASPVSLSLTELLTGPSAIAVDDQGILYMAVQATTTSIVKFNPTLPAGSRVVATSTYGFSFSSYPRGIMVKGAYVYVTDPTAGKLVRLDKNLQLVDTFSGSPTSPFTRPETFVATLNKMLTVIDEGTSVDRLTAFNDMTGAGWTTLGSVTNGSGQNQFAFYSFC